MGDVQGGNFKIKCTKKFFYFVMGAYGYIGRWIADQKAWGSDLRTVYV